MPDDKQDKIDSTEQSVTKLWDTISVQFKAHRGISFKSVFLTGLSTRIHKNRLSKLRGTKQAQFMFESLKDLPSHQIKALRTFAAINQEQAISAFRLTMVGNISIPIAVIAILHQLLPNGLGATILDFYNDDQAAIIGLAMGFIIGITLISIIALYALGNLNQARDIRHLIDLHAAERGIYFGLEDMDDLSLS